MAALEELKNISSISRKELMSDLGYTIKKLKKLMQISEALFLLTIPSDLNRGIQLLQQNQYSNSRRARSSKIQHTDRAKNQRPSHFSHRLIRSKQESIRRRRHHASERLNPNAPAFQPKKLKCE